jgi:hypothetical protein
MNVRIREMTRNDTDFYTYFGPVFGNRDIARQVGLHAYDDANKTWIAAFDGDRLVGWLSIRGSLVSDCFVVESHRRMGVFATLLNHTVSRHGNALRAVCTKASRSTFSNAGFIVTKVSKNFSWMEMRHA